MAKWKKILDSNNCKVLFYDTCVVSKELVKSIRMTVEDNMEAAVDMDLMFEQSARENFIFDISLFLNDLKEAKYITQWDVIADRRNNTGKDINNGMINLVLKFRQWNCINNTYLHYKIEKRTFFKKNKSLGRVIL